MLNFNSIAIKTSAYIALFTIAFILFIIFVVKNLFTDSYINLERDKVAIIAQNISSPLALNISYGFTQAISEISNKALTNKNVLLIKINNYEDNTVKTFTNHDKNLNEYIKEHEILHSNKLLDPTTSKDIGELTIVYSNQTYLKYMRIFNVWFFWGVVGFAISLFSLSLFLYKSLKRLSILDDALKSFNPENPAILKLDIDTNDEISSISKSANIMIDNIIEYINNYKEVTSELILSHGHLKDAQRMARVGSLDYTIDTDTLILSDEYYRILGINLHTKFTWIDFLKFIDKTDYLRVSKEIQMAISNRSTFNIKYALALKNNKQIFIQTSGKVRHKKDGTTKLTAISMDITKDIKNKQTIEKLAYFDSLTGLANRAQLKSKMAHFLNLAKVEKDKMAVIFLDLDHFKLINDTLGHSVGDELLKYIASTLKAQIGEDDILSRLGGDEFVIFIPSIQSVKDIKNLASKIQKSLEHKHTIGTHQLYITSSIGLAVYPEHGTTSDELIRNADTAMYEAKNDGRNKYKFYSKAMGTVVDKQLNMEQDLANAIKNKKEIEVFYQAKIDTFSKEIIGAEALVRWNHPKNGLIFPDEFIFMAESTGLMVDLGNIITEQSISTLKEINELKLNKFKLAINLSARQFQDISLIPFVESILRKYKILPEQVEFEITESISMSNMQNTLRILTKLREIGISIAIDDFGTGHSSLAYLKRFPINTLKIDKSFVMDIVDDEDDRVITQTIISMAHSLGLNTVAEGVETKEHVEMLNEMGCDILQGYFYSKPISKDKFVEFIKEYKPS